MARRKNTKRIDPRYFLNETVDRDIDTGEALEELEMPWTRKKREKAEAAAEAQEKDFFARAPNMSSEEVEKGLAGIKKLEAAGIKADVADAVADRYGALLKRKRELAHLAKPNSREKSMARPALDLDLTPQQLAARSRRTLAQHGHGDPRDLEEDEDQDPRDLLAMQHDATEEQEAWRDSIEEKRGYLEPPDPSDPGWPWEPGETVPGNRSHPYESQPILGTPKRRRGETREQYEMRIVRGGHRDQMRLPDPGELDPYKLEEDCAPEEGGAPAPVDDISQLSPEEAYAAGMAAARDAIDQAMGGPDGPPPEGALE